MAQGRSYEPTTRPSDAWAGWITIMLGVLVLFAITARWSEAQAAR